MAKIKYEITWNKPTEAYMSGRFFDKAALQIRMTDFANAIVSHVEENGSVDVHIKLELAEEPKEEDMHWLGEPHGQEDRQG